MLMRTLKQTANTNVTRVIGDVRRHGSPSEMAYQEKPLHPLILMLGDVTDHFEQEVVPGVDCSLH